MSFTPKPTIMKLVFDEDTPLHGLTVRARSCTIGQWEEMLAWSDEQSKSAEEVKAKNERFVRFFLEHVEDWDLEIPQGSPVPLTLDGWKTIDKDHAELIIAAWQFAMMSVPKMSKKISSDGASSPEQSLDLANLSESLPSWNPPS